MATASGMCKRIQVYYYDGVKPPNSKTRTAVWDLIPYILLLWK